MSRGCVFLTRERQPNWLLFTGQECTELRICENMIQKWGLLRKTEGYG